MVRRCALLPADDSRLRHVELSGYLLQGDTAACDVVNHPEPVRFERCDNWHRSPHKTRARASIESDFIELLALVNRRGGIKSCLHIATRNKLHVRRVTTCNHCNRHLLNLSQNDLYIYMGFLENRWLQWLQWLQPFKFN
nr:MAG TPA: hypothetical protein [Caudoviricetes sp.]